MVIRKKTPLPYGRGSVRGARGSVRVLLIALMAVPLSAQGLRDWADQRGIRLGAAVDPSHFGETLYADTLAREFNQVEPENAMKFGPIHPSPTSYNFGPPDSIVAFAKAHNMAVRGHTLVWHSQVPTWVTNGNYTSVQLSSILQDHINTVMSHYAGQVYAWDVVNEAFNDDGTMRSTIWSNTPGIGLSGTGYIEQALRWAHAADPRALLFYNDYNGESVNAKSNAIYQMAQDFRTRGVPLDGVGLQMHFTASPPSLSGIEANIKRLTDLGLQVQITEFDVRLTVDSSGNATSAALATQAQTYRDITAICLRFPLCTAIQTWGFTDKYSWVPGTFPGMGAALEFNATYQPKSAYTSMRDALSGSPPVLSAAGIASAASYANQAFAPGEILAVFGSSFGPASMVSSQADGSGRLPTTLSSVRVWFDDAPAPILWSQVGLTGAIVPFSVAGKTTAQVRYEYQGVTSAPVTVKIAPTVPGLFTANASGVGAGAILDPAFHLILQANPARRGDVIVLFATGGGVTTPAIEDGQISTAAPYPRVTVTTTARIGGVDCAVEYVGGTYGFVAGALQINVRVADGVPAGEQPVTVTIAGASSQAGVTVWVQ